MGPRESVLAWFLNPWDKGEECLVNCETDGEIDLYHHPSLFKEVPTGPKATKLGELLLMSWPIARVCLVQTNTGKLSETVSK